MKENWFLSCLGAILLFAVVLVSVVFLNAWAMSTLWNWFVVPIFEAPALSFLQAYGLACVIGVFFPNAYKSLATKKKDGDENAYVQFGTILLSPVMSVFIGWIVLQLM